MLLPLFTHLRSQPLSRVSSVLRANLDAFDAIADDLAHAYGNARVEDNDTAYTITIALPGFKREEVSVEVENTYLTISASRGGGKVEGTQTKTGQSTSRTITLPSDTDPTKVEAKMEDGMLTLQIAKLAQPAPRKVVVS